MNIKDIARLAGVSVSTTSRVLNNHQDVCAQTRDKVMKVIKLHNYTPNSNAKSLKQSNSKNIAIIVKGNYNSLFLYMVERLQRQIEKLEFSVLVSYIEHNANEVLEAEKMCREKKPQAIIFLGGNVHNFEKDFSIKIPCVIVTTSTKELAHKNLSSVSVDDFLGGYMAIDYLICNGHKKIAILASEFSSLVELRLNGAIKRMKESGIDFDNDLFVDASFSIDIAYDKTKELLASGKSFTAIFAMADIMAIGASKAIFNAGHSVPDDYSIIGFDGTFLAQYYNPEITTLRQPVEQMSDDALEMILNAIERKHPSSHNLYKLEIVQGGSVRNLLI